MVDKTVPELARETLKQLIGSKMAPTPANYRSVFNEIGQTAERSAVSGGRAAQDRAALPARTPGQQKQRGLLEYAVSQLNWTGCPGCAGGVWRVSRRATAWRHRVRRRSPADRCGSFGAGDAAHGCATSAPALTTEFLEQIARLIEFARPALGTDDARFTEQTNELLQAMREPGCRRGARQAAAQHASGTACRLPPRTRSRSRPHCCICCA